MAGTVAEAWTYGAGTSTVADTAVDIEVDGPLDTQVQSAPGSTNGDVKSGGGADSATPQLGNVGSGTATPNFPVLLGNVGSGGGAGSATPHVPVLLGSVKSEHDDDNVKRYAVATRPSVSFFDPDHQASSLQASRLTCATCGGEVAPIHLRLLSKREGTWRCLQCKVKVVQIYREYGSYPPPAFGGIPEAHKQRFMQKLISGNVDQKGLKVSLTNFLESYSAEESSYYDGGKFLPLSVWETKGFNIVAIEAMSQEADKRMHPIFGIVYRVNILSMGTSGKRGTIERDANESEQPKLKKPKIQELLGLLMQSGAGADVGTGTVAEPGSETRTSEKAVKPDSSSDSSSSESSSSSSDKKKKKKKHKKKDKKSKKEKKRKTKAAKEAKEQKESEKEAAKAAKLLEAAGAKSKQQSMTLATSVHTKVAPALAKLCMALAKPSAALLPDQIKTAAVAVQIKMDKLVNDAKVVTATGGATNHCSVSTTKDLQ